MNIKTNWRNAIVYGIPFLFYIGQLLTCIYIGAGSEDGDAIVAGSILVGLMISVALGLILNQIFIVD